MAFFSQSFPGAGRGKNLHAMSKGSHSFSVSVACILDIPMAIILQHLIFLQDGTEDGWAKKSNKAMQETYPYLTPKQLRGALERMERDDIIISDFRNESKADRTKSYFVTSAGRAIYGKEPFAERANAISQKGKSDVAKRANQMLPKGQMNNKVYYSNIVNSVSSTPAPAQAEISSDLNTELPYAKKRSSAAGRADFAAELVGPPQGPHGRRTTRRTGELLPAISRTMAGNH